jgi:Flp pilus assembly protein TadG
VEHQRSPNFRSKITERRGDAERGAALVEFAIVLTLFFLLIFGMIEFGNDYNNYIAVRNGTREAARMGVVNDLSGAPSCTIAGTTVTPPSTITATSTTADATNALICKTKSRIGLGNATKVQIVVPPSATIGGTLQVCASYPVTSITGLVAPFVSGKKLVSSVTMRLEQQPYVQSYSNEGSIC